MSEPKVLTAESVRALLPPRPAGSNKGDNGRALLLIGSEAYTGAALLASAAALRAGCGLLYAGVPAAIKPSFSALPEAMCVPLGHTGCWDAEALTDARPLLSGKHAVCMGCGMGKMADDRLLAAALSSNVPLVLDADALNFLSAHPAYLAQLRENTVLTPHVGEMARLTGLDILAIKANAASVACEYAEKWNCVVLLKDAVSVIAGGGRCCVNTSGNAGLAKGGSGDVLSGLITGLLAQGLTAFDAACAGAFLLGSSAETAFRLLGNRMLVATDVISAVSDTLHAIEKQG